MDQRDRMRTTPIEGRAREPDSEPIGLDSDAPPPPRRFPRFVSAPTSKRVSRQRLAVAIVGSVALIVGLGALGTGAVSRMLGYLRGLPAYQLSYREIELEPPPPAWYRGGKEAFLDHVWTVWPERKVFSTLDVDPERIRSLFQRFPWVERVRGAEALPGRRFVVRLDYRVPVAIAEFPDGNKVWVDRDGVLLPRDDVDDELAATLVGLHGFPPPAEPRPGETWSRFEGRGDQPRPDTRVVEAAALATFLKARLGELTGQLAGPPHAVVQLFKERGLYVQIYGDSVADSLMLYWLHDPLSEAATAHLTDEAKWSLFREWLGRSAPRVEGKLVYLWFSRRGVEIDSRYATESPTSLNDRRLNGKTRRR